MSLRQQSALCISQMLSSVSLASTEKLPTSPRHSSSLLPFFVLQNQLLFYIYIISRKSSPINRPVQGYQRNLSVAHRLPDPPPRIKEVSNHNINIALDYHCRLLACVFSLYLFLLVSKISHSSLLSSFPSSFLSCMHAPCLLSSAVVPTPNLPVPMLQ